MRAAVAWFVALTVFPAWVLAQTPQPFPRPGGATSPAPAPPPGQATARRPQPPPTTIEQAVPTPPPRPAGPPPTGPVLSVPMYPTAQLLASYDAGRGQRYYMFGATAPFADLVAYYRSQLRDRGTLVFEDPPTHMFEVGRFREESMAFPPSVTIKDWTFGGSKGYPNPKPGAEPARFPTVIVVVPPPPGNAN